MKKNRKWQLVLILAVIAWTIYNILPTLFFYSKPLQQPLSKSEAENTVKQIVSRIDLLESDTIEWLHSYCDLLHLKPQSIASGETPDSITISFAKSEDAEILKKFLPRAGSLIPFVPAQLRVGLSENPKEVAIQRQIAVRMRDLANQGAFEIVSKKEEDGSLSPRYCTLIRDRASAIVNALGSPGEIFEDPLSGMVAKILEVAKLQESAPALAGRLAAQFAKTHTPKEVVEQIALARDALKKGKGKKEDTESLDLEKKELKLAAAEAFLKKRIALFAPQTATFDPFADSQSISHPLFSKILIDWEKNQIRLKIHSDLMTIHSDLVTTDKNLIEQLLIDESAKITRLTNETISRSGNEVIISLQKSPALTAYLTLSLDSLGKAHAEHLLSNVRSDWHPQHPDLKNMRVVSKEVYDSLPFADKKLALVVSAPASEVKSLDPSLQNGSLYVVFKGFLPLLQIYKETPESDLAKTLASDLQQLSLLLRQHGFIGYVGGKDLVHDYIFEKPQFYQSILTASREEFKRFGFKPMAVLELSNYEERMLTTNRIESQIHNDLLKWQDEYRTATVNLNPQLRFDVPKPTRSVFWSNLQLTFRKLFRGDERKILRWGLDLSGGKSVLIELRNQNNQIVTEDADLKQGINELFNRVNKMGVSDVSIRQVGNRIALDFPGSQAMSASELVKASSMFFHVLNEKFGSHNLRLSDPVHRFLQEVWNEAVVANRKDPESIQEIAYRHLHGEHPSESAALLLEEGLKLAAPDDLTIGKSVEETISKVVLLRGTEPHEWWGQTHPLLIVFRNHVLEGSNLDNIRSNYDATQGNYLSFEVAGRDARSDLFAWTSLFSKDRILGTEREIPSRGQGWRMAVLLNGTVISAPTLREAIRDSATISGNFTQREVAQLASDLRAGSLTFTPHILSEKNVSPDLGQTERVKGIGATVVAFVLVVVSMIAYYRFAGFVASVAVFFNLLILWAVLQNLGASLSLAGLAGVILTVGMAVDANVLVFERMKEEMKHSGNLASAIHAGYEKAFSAIVDSNVTTILAALILLNFDAGPIKAFAVSMIIGIASSMFTALFMTRFYFNGWVKNPKHDLLTMADWIRSPNADFLKQAKLAFAVAGALIVGGGALLVAERSTLFGMDFTGGYALTIELQNSPDSVAIEQALLSAGATSQDFHIREQEGHFQILFGTSMEQTGKPFHGLPLEQKMESASFSKNPRIDWVIANLNKADLSVAPASLKTLDLNWTSMSGQMSESMRNNAILGLALAFIGIFIYIAFRFEYKYAIAAILCLLHDVLITLGCIGFLHYFRVPIQIDLNTIAAVMTIIGYSLNDTIIIFDRIREDVRLYPNKSMRDIVNLALNNTLSRTAITSGTTLLVLLALLFFGGPSIFGFSLVMVIGIIFGTLSSWYIASPLMLFFHKKEEEVENAVVVLEDR